MDHLVSEKFLKTKFSLCEVGVIYSEALHCGNTLENTDHVYLDLV